MSYKELIKSLRCKGLSKECDTCEYGYRLSPDSECNDACDRMKLENDAADALEAADNRISRLEEDLKTREAEREVMQDTIKICEEAADRYKAQLPKRGEWIRVEGGESYHYECSRCGERPLYSRFGDIVFSGVCPVCGAKMEVQE